MSDWLPQGLPCFGNHSHRCFNRWGRRSAPVKKHMKVDMVADMGVDKVADMEVDLVVNLVVGKVANMKVDMVAYMKVEKVIDT